MTLDETGWMWWSVVFVVEVVCLFVCLLRLFLPFHIGNPLFFFFFFFQFFLLCA